MRFLLLACLAIAAVSADQETCEPGSVTKQDCNSCICSKDGKSRMCTLMMCPPATRTRRQALQNSAADQETCEPGSVIKQDCNTCICSKDGKSRMCTMMMCPPETRTRRQALQNSAADQETCEPGSVIKQDCNTCICSKDGKSRMCTMMMCPPETRTRRQALQNSAADQETCEPGSVIKQDCNTCVCSKDGKSRMCTMMMCPPETRTRRQALQNSAADQETCEPGSVIKQDCNTCVCSKDGKSRMCTMMMCPPETRTRRQATEQVCEPGSTKMADCNHCFCLADGSAWGCTAMACPTKVCQPGSTSKKFCNTCICGVDGISVACTRKRCSQDIFNEDGSLKHPEPVTDNSLLRQRRQVSDDRPCVPGERFKNYCNTCTCGADGISVACTRKACPKEIFNEDGSLKHPEQFTENPLLRQRRQLSDDRPCVPGERFKKYCNTCTCGADGISVACTRKRCSKDIFNEDGSLKHPEPVTDNPLLRQRRQVSDDRPCVPGERFKNYCNTCTCGADGISVACTRKRCSKDIFNEDGSLKHPEPVTDNPLLRQRRQVSDDRPCVPGERFKNYCNTCTCGADGFSVACTRRACPKEIFNEDGSLKHPEQFTENPPLRQKRQLSDDRPCVPGERFKNYCNTCTCGADGFSVACTRKACPKEIFNEDGSLKHPEQFTENPPLRQRRQFSE